MAEPRRILVVDNEPDQLAMMREILERVGCRVDTTDSPHEALRMVARETFDLLVVDLIMPEIDGTDLCERIKRIRPELCVFAFSGHGHLYDHHRLKRAGFDGRINKPATLQEIGTALAAVKAKPPESGG